MSATTNTKVFICVGLLITLAAPFVQNLISYLEGREVLPFGLSLISFLVCLLAGVVCGLILMQLAQADKTQRKVRLVVGIILLIGGPVYFFIFGKGAATMELCGLADEARSKVNLMELQEWAVKKLESQNFVAETNSSHDLAQMRLSWETVPADAQAFIGTNGSVYMQVWPDGRTNILLIDPPRALQIGTTNFVRSTDKFWNYKLAPGIYLGHYIRP